MRWNETCDLLSNGSRYQDSSGGWHEGEQEARTVFCNRYTLSATAWIEYMDNGLRPEAEIQLRTVDYSGEPEVRYGGVEYDIVRSTVSGDLTRLVLERHLSNDG